MSYLLNQECFYTDLPVRQVINQPDPSFFSTGFYTDLPVRQVEAWYKNRKVEIEFLYRPARKAGRCRDDNDSGHCVSIQTCP